MEKTKKYTEPKKGKTVAKTFQSNKIITYVHESTKLMIAKLLKMHSIPVCFATRN